VFELAQVLLAAATPAAGGLIGWGTNFLAVQMLFEPLERRGLGPLGWQGVIPAQAEVMAHGCADLLLERLVDPAELGARLDAGEAARLLEPAFQDAAADALERALARRHPRMWRALPSAVRLRLLERARAAVPGQVEGVLREVARDLTTTLDLRRLIVEAFRADRALLGELFRRCGAAEFRFVILTGLVCGFLLGLLQLLAWVTVGQPAWLFPLVGALTGGATNWLALWLVFAPVEAVQLGPWRVRGLFLERQAEVSAAYAAFFAERVLSAPRLIAALPLDELGAEVEARSARQLERWGRGASPALRLALRAWGGEALRGEVSASIGAIVPELPPLLEPYLEERLELERTLRERLEALSPREFVSVLRPVFQAEEWKLTAIGAALGAAAGGLQATLLLLA